MFSWISSRELPYVTGKSGYIGCFCLLICVASIALSLTFGLRRGYLVFPQSLVVSTVICFDFLLFFDSSFSAAFDNSIRYLQFLLQRAIQFVDEIYHIFRLNLSHSASNFSPLFWRIETMYDNLYKSFLHFIT